MITSALIEPRSIAIIGGSNDVRKPGGKVLKNLISGSFSGMLYVANSREDRVQGLPSHRNVQTLPDVDLAIIAVPASVCPDIMEELAAHHSTKAFIILSAGFGEAGEEGVSLEKELVRIANEHGACLIGPNCIGVLNQNYQGVFTSPIPNLEPRACDLISGSGATAVFIMEAGQSLGVRFTNVYSVGNSAQTGVEDILEYMDVHFDPENDPPVKLLYIESLKNPSKFLKHTSSLIRKGAKIAAIKAGLSKEGSRAASSHTGAVSSSNMAVRALFRKAGIVFCSSREELLSVASIFRYKKPKGKNFAIITHAGGSAVMLTDVLTDDGLMVPELSGSDTLRLAQFLHPGSSVSNPIDFLATGNADQLGIIIDFCEHKFHQIDAMVVVFGSAGLFDVENVYNVLSVKLEVCTKPIYPVLPSVVNAEREISRFLAKGHVNFPDEVVLGRALCAVLKTPEPAEGDEQLHAIDTDRIRKLVDASPDGYLSPEAVSLLLDSVGIPRVEEFQVRNHLELETAVYDCGFPLVMKVVGPVHKTDSGGVELNLSDLEACQHTFKRLMSIEGATAVLIQPMLSGIELYAGAIKEDGYGHIVIAGLGGIFMEVLMDVSASLIPVTPAEANRMIENLRGFKILEGYRGKVGADREEFSRIIRSISILCRIAPEIAEMDINPLIGSGSSIRAVDCRIRISKD